MLASRITLSRPSLSDLKQDEDRDGHQAEVEDETDLFSCFLPHLFPDEAPPCLGEPGQTLVYSSALFGDLRLMIPDYSSEKEEALKQDAAAAVTGGGGGGGGGGVGDGVEASRQLFAHYLWGAALVVAEGIEDAARLERTHTYNGLQNAMKWSVKGQRVLEVGAGVALPSLISILAGADHVTITDHPSSAALYGPIQFNIAKSIPNPTLDKRQVSIQPHEWGVFDTDVPFISENRGGFTRIICADCLWMADQHVNLVKTILWFLSPTNKHGGGDDSTGGVCWVVAGFHTGRKTVASFFETAMSMGLVIEEIWERDVHSSTGQGESEVTRPWKPVREDEGPENRSRWCVVAILRV